MLSRIAFRPKIAHSFALGQCPWIRCASTEVAATTTTAVEPTIKEEKENFLKLLQQELPKPYDGPERDHVNFPRRKRSMYPNLIRYGLIPQDWFDFFYKKTGVTGPYVFGFGLTTFLLSKEFYVLEAEASTALAQAIFVYLLVTRFGPMLRKYLTKEIHQEVKDFEDQMAGEKQHYVDLLAKGEVQRVHVGLADTILEAKKENIQMQLEADFRKRQMMVYQAVKKRLDYFADIDNTRRKLEQKHMVDWVVQSVMASITPQQEKEALQKCVADLKVLSAHSSV